jgi:hypothetical protein
MKGAVEGARKGVRQSSLSHAGHVLDQEVPPGEKGDEGKLDDLVFAPDYAPDGPLEAGEQLRLGALCRRAVIGDLWRLAGRKSLPSVG